MEDSVQSPGVTMDRCRLESLWLKTISSDELYRVADWAARPISKMGNLFYVCECGARVRHHDAERIRLHDSVEPGKPDRYAHSKVDFKYH